MAIRHRRTWNILAALVVPVVVEAVLVVVEKTFYSAVPWYGNSLSGVISCATGFLILVFEFRVYALVIALVYVPTMLFLMRGVALMVAGGLGGGL